MFSEVVAVGIVELPGEVADARVELPDSPGLSTTLRPQTYHTFATICVRLAANVPNANSHGN